MKKFLLEALQAVEKLLIGAVAEIEEHSIPLQTGQGILKASCQMYVKAHPGTLLAEGCREMLKGIAALEAQENADAQVGGTHNPGDPTEGTGG